MPVASSPSTSKRLLALLTLLQSPRDWPAPLLAERLDVSERTIRRDVERLRELDYAIEATRGPDGGYRLGAGTRLPPMLFDEEQAVAIALALRTASALGADVGDAADRALGTMSRLLPDRLSRRIESVTAGVTAATDRITVGSDPAVLLRITDAIRSGEAVRFDYATPAGAGPGASRGGSVRVVEPHALVLRSGRWYLLGYAEHAADWRVYRVDRMTPRTHNGHRFAPRPIPGGDAATYLAARFKGSPDADRWPMHGEATVHAPIAEISPYIDDGSVVAVDSQRSRVRLGSWSWGGLAAAFARFDAELSDVEPAALRDAFAGLAARAAGAARIVRPARPV